MLCFNNIAIKLGGKKAKNQILKEMMRISSFLKLTVLMLSESALSDMVEAVKAQCSIPCLENLSVDHIRENVLS